MDDRIRCVQQAVVIVLAKSEIRISEISAENSDPSLQMFVKSREVEMQLQRLPQPDFSLMRIARSNQNVQRGSVLIQQVSCNMRTDVSGRAG